MGRGELSQEFLDFSGGKREEKRESENFSISRHVHEIKTKVCITVLFIFMDIFNFSNNRVLYFM